VPPERQHLTKAVYEDPEIVAGYIERHARSPKLTEVITAFAKTIPGNRVLDLGCGPGHDAYQFAKLGYEVIGLDYSSTMIEAAKKFDDTDRAPSFAVGDMRNVAALFAPDRFDGVWASASLLHISPQDITPVLQGVRTVTKNGGRVYIGIKEGIFGERIIVETKYGKPIQRDFTFWEQESFTKALEENNFQIDSMVRRQDNETSTKWLNFFATVKK
jgi:ubiquinone/menaquinone biosynthesis C-methylase UbiE